MSFNFSDIEAEDEFDLEEFDETGLLAEESRTRDDAIIATSDQKNTLEDDADDSDENDWDNVDWEDAADEQDEPDSEEHEEILPSFPQEGITIQIGRKAGVVGRSNNPDDYVEQTEEEKKSEEEAVHDDAVEKKPRKATVRVLRNVPIETQQLVMNVRRSHLLCCMIHSLQCSSLCSDISHDASGIQGEILFNVALSLIPEQFHTDPANSTTASSFTIPTVTTVKQFSEWFFEFVDNAAQRRRRAIGRNVAQGATTRSARKRRRTDDASYLTTQIPTISTLLRRLTHLSPCYDDEPQLFLDEQEGLDPILAVESITAQEKVMLFLTMIRSLRWRARYVTSLQAIPLKLTVDHPLFRDSSLQASSNVKTSANNVKDTTAVMQKMFQLINEGNDIPTSGRKQKKPKRESAKKKKEDDVIDLVNSGDTDVDKYTMKEAIPIDNGMLSWIEILCDKTEGGKAIKKQKLAAQWTPILLEQKSIGQPEIVENILAWKDSDEANSNRNHKKGKAKGRKGAKYGRVNAHRTPKKSPVSYVVAVEHVSVSHACDATNTQVQGVRLTDVTRRYASRWSMTLSLRGATSKDIKERRGKCVDKWFETSLKQLNNHFRPAGYRRESKAKQSNLLVRSVAKVKGSSGKLVDVLELESSDEEDRKPAAKILDFDNDDDAIKEKEELNDNAKHEEMPKSKAAFKNHAYYVIPSVLNSKEVLHPDARKRICGVFKGELVYRRNDVSTALKAKKWLYVGRKVKDSEIQKPVKKVKARKKPKKKGFQALESYGISESAQDEAIAALDKNGNGEEDENMDNLYGVWQTEGWSPPYILPSDPIPTNEYKNVEKELLNPGLTHMEQPRLASIAKRLGVPYAPCMIGFDRGKPFIRGIVVHNHNVSLIREAAIEWESHVVEKERKERRKEVLRKWKRLVVGLITKERLERDYGNH